MDRALIRRAFGRTVRNLRLKAGIAQEELALTSHINRGYMGGLERGEHSPTLETLYKLLPALQVTFPQFAAEFDRVLKRLVNHPRSRK